MNRFDLACRVAALVMAVWLPITIYGQLSTMPVSETTLVVPGHRFRDVKGKEIYRVKAGDVLSIRGRSITVTKDGFVLLTGEFVTILEHADSLVREALKYLGTPYVWGGNSLTKGIDSSHFVHQILRRSGYNCPSAPVVNQENYGQIVHYKGPKTVARRMRQTITLPNTEKYPFASSDFSVLRPGDRIICQFELSEQPGTRHTGIFVGRVRVGGRTFQYGVVHASGRRVGVTVNDLRDARLWKTYKFSLRDGKSSVNVGGDVVPRRKASKVRG